LSSNEYFKLTPAETHTIVNGWLWRNELASSNFRELFTLQYNQFAKRGGTKTSSQLWPLKLLDKRFTMFETAEDEYKWRQKMLDFGVKFFKN